MPDEHALTLRQADQARSDLYAIGDELDFIKGQLARLPTRKEMAQTALLATLTAFRARPCWDRSGTAGRRAPASITGTS
jgi:hypothetical protein